MTREEYIDFANALKNNYTIDFNKLPEFCDMAISALSTKPIRPKGLWKIHDLVRHLYRCSECQTITQIRFNFCPNCGADMRGE